jgi:tRNA pseudouridine65 synthase
MGAFSSVPASSESLPLGPGVVVLKHHPAGLFALEKPPGVLSHPNAPEDADRSLLRAPYDNARECYLLPNGGEAHLIHRLDSPTSGVILVATDSALAAELRSRFYTRDVKKTYLALVFGVPRRHQELWEDRLQMKKEGGQLRTHSRENGDSATCEMRQLQIITGVPILTLLELTPHTGRTHQLRVQCQKRRLPIVGDTTYGDFTKNRSFARKGSQARLFLHAASISIPLPFAAKPNLFTASSPTPREFQRPR